MNRNIIAIALVTAICISMAAPIEADAAAFLAAGAAIWAVAAAAGITVVAVNNKDDNQQTQQATHKNELPSKDSPTQFAKVEPSTTFNEESYELNLP